MSTEKYNFALILMAVIFHLNTNAQDTLSGRGVQDTLLKEMNMDAVYNRPSLIPDKYPVTLGGYLEANSIYSIEDGISEGISFQARRLTLFMFASITERIKFLTEIEFEDGTKEIAIEFAAMDLTLYPELNFRGGIILNPIGSFNQNHDGPKWEFVERPDVATNLLPATFSNAGFGIYGKKYIDEWVIGYEAYLTNGFDTRIINNEQERTFLPAIKDSESRFDENFSGKALFTGKLAIKKLNIAELGLSYMGGVYNRQEEDGLQIDTSTRRVDVVAVDINSTFKGAGTKIIGEAAYIWVDVPQTFTQQFGNKQMGFFVDVVQPVLSTRVLEWNAATLNLGARIDYVDFNIGKFSQTGTEIGDELFAITPAISFRPTPQTVIRINYRYQWQEDILGNPATKSSTLYFGFSTYF